MNMHRRRLTCVVILSVASVACGPQGPKPAKPPSPAKSPQLVWPLPPEKPRIRFVAAYRGSADFGKKESKWRSLLLGPEARQQVDALVKPYGVTADSAGRIYATDTASRKVFVFDPTNRSVRFVADTGQGKVAKPIGVAVDSEGKVFVADATLNRIFGYGPDGALAIAIGHEGEFENPSGLAVDSILRRVYVADSKKHQVFCYSSTDGAFIRAIGQRGMEPGQFNFPTNLFVDGQSRLFVADTLNFRVQIFDPDGGIIKAIGAQGDSPGTFNRPKGVGVDSEGHIYVADASFNNFQIFDPDGKLLLFVGLPGRGPGEFLLPAGLFVDAQDRIYVADQGNARVQVFQYLKDSP